MSGDGTHNTHTHTKYFNKTVEVSLSHYSVVYALGLWAQPAHTERGKKERVREISKTKTSYSCNVGGSDMPSLVSLAATFFQQNPACTHRLVPWLTREFRVLLGPTHVQFMIQLVLSLVDKWALYTYIHTLALSYTMYMLPLVIQCIHELYVCMSGAAVSLLIRPLM